MKGRYTYLALIVLGFFAFAALAYIKIGPEKLMLWYYKYANRENLIKLIPVFGAFVVLCIIILLVMWRVKKIKAKRAKEEAGIDLRDLFSDSGL